MLETIQQIKDLANVTENLYLLNKITLLEQQIEINIIDAKIKASSIIINNKLNN